MVVLVQCQVCEFVFEFGLEIFVVDQFEYLDFKSVLVVVEVLLQEWFQCEYQVELVLCEVMVFVMYVIYFWMGVVVVYELLFEVVFSGCG